MAIYTREEAKKILEKALSFSKADACEINLSGRNSGNIRYARNTVSTAGYQSNQSLVVQSSFGKKVGTATIDEFDDASGQRRTSVLFGPIRQKPASSGNEWSVSPGALHHMPMPHSRQKRSLSTERSSLTL